MHKQEKTSFYVIWKLLSSFRIRLIMAFGFAGIIAGLSLMPGPPLNNRWNIPFLDKIGHFIAYAIFAKILIGLFKSEVSIIKPILWTFTIATSYGMLMEVLQIFVPDRTFSYTDMLANTLGITMILVISYYKNGLAIGIATGVKNNHKPLI